MTPAQRERTAYAGFVRTSLRACDRKHFAAIFARRRLLNAERAVRLRAEIQDGERPRIT
jgi:hypothetical protein